MRRISVPVYISISPPERFIELDLPTEVICLRFTRTQMDGSDAEERHELQKLVEYLNQPSNHKSP